MSTTLLEWDLCGSNAVSDHTALSFNFSDGLVGLFLYCQEQVELSCRLITFVLSPLCRLNYASTIETGTRDQRPW